MIGVVVVFRLSWVVWIDQDRLQSCEERQSLKQMRHAVESV